MQLPFIAVKTLYKTGNTNRISDSLNDHDPVTPSFVSDATAEDQSTSSSLRRSVSHSVSEQSQNPTTEDEDNDDDVYIDNGNDNDDNDLAMENELDALLTYVGKDSFLFPFFTHQLDTVCC